MMELSLFDKHSAFELIVYRNGAVMDVNYGRIKVASALVAEAGPFNRITNQPP